MTKQEYQDFLSYSNIVDKELEYQNLSCESFNQYHNTIYNKLYHIKDLGLLNALNNSSFRCGVLDMSTSL